MGNIVKAWQVGCKHLHLRRKEEAGIRCTSFWGLETMPNSFPVLSQPVHPAVELAQRLQEQARAGHACSARTGRQLVVAELGFGSLSLCCWCWGSRHPQGYHQRVSPAAQQETHPKGRNSSFLKQDLCFYPGLWLQRAAASQAECLTKSGLHI